MLHLIARGLVIAASILTSQGLVAENIVTEVAVLSSEPVFSEVSESHLPDHCFNSPPSRRFDDLLGWDIDCEETVSESVLMGYDVRYELDGKQFRYVAEERPGTTIPLLLTLE